MQAVCPDRMGTYSHLRQRRSAAQLYAVSQVEREVRAADPHSGDKYIRVFAEAFQTYRSRLSRSGLLDELLQADVLLVADYHALPASQHYTANLIEQLSERAQRPLVLALEAIFARDQRVARCCGATAGSTNASCAAAFASTWIGASTGIRFFICLRLPAGTASACTDSIPRRVATFAGLPCAMNRRPERIATIAREVPDSRLVVLFGESHMAPQHLPALLRRKLPQARVVTLLQNVDSLYWQAEEEPGARVKAVRVSRDVFCVFNATPLEKYESYRQCLERWGQARPSAVDLAPAFYNLISALARYLGLDRCRRDQWRRLAELQPDVVIHNSVEHFRRPLQRAVAADQMCELMRQIEADGCAYCTATNAIYAQTFELPGAAMAAARFVHAVCSGSLDAHARPVASTFAAPEDGFYGACLTETLAEFGARVLHSARGATTGQELDSGFARSRRQVELAYPFSYHDYLRMIDFVTVHQDFQCHARLYRDVPQLIREGRGYTGDKLRFVSRLLGQDLGARLYQAYLEGRVDRRYLRSLYFRRLAGRSKLIYFQLASRTQRRGPSLLHR